MGWKCRLISQGGRLNLLRHVLSSLPIYLLSVLQVPEVVIWKLNGLFAKFFWGGGNKVVEVRGNGEHGRSCACLWKKGELGGRKLDEVQRSLFLKFGWNLLTQESL